MRPLVKIIDLAALRDNLHQLAQLSAPAKIMAVVKANAYGHGIAHVLPALKQAEQLAVACIEEALELRELGAKQPIVLLEGVFDRQELSICRQQHFIPFIHQQRQIEWLQDDSSETSTPLPIWLKIDSGMHRLGIPIHQAKNAIETIQALDGVCCLGVATHFACADEQDLAHARGQLAMMNRLDLPANWQRCYANSAALLQLPSLHTDWVRPGLALYGMSPMPHQSISSFDLRPVMTLQTQIIDTHYLLEGEAAGYGQGFCAPRSGTLATIAIGYGDGLARHIPPNRLQVNINDQTYPIVGRIAMDMSLVWLGENAQPVGSRVTLWGEGHRIEHRAQEAETIPYTLTTSLTNRVHTRVING